jgi:hypothetical protein
MGSQIFSGDLRNLKILLHQGFEDRGALGSLMDFAFNDVTKEKFGSSSGFVSGGRGGAVVLSEFGRLCIHFDLRSKERAPLALMIRSAVAAALRASLWTFRT